MKLSRELRKQIKKASKSAAKTQRIFSRENIANMDDNALHIQASLWAEEKYRDAFHTAPLPCQYVVACSNTFGSAMNGGLSALFAERSRCYVPAAIEGYALVGMHTASEILQQAQVFYAQVYDENGDVLNIDETPEHFDAEQELDRKFDDACKEIDARLAEYIRANAEWFGDL